MMIEARNIVKRYGDLEVLRGVDLDIAQGEIVSIVGPSGAGKTTLLQIIGTLDAPQQGEVCYEGKNVEQVRFECGKAMGEADDTEVDCACGIPDSGVGMATGYAVGAKVPYLRCIAKYTPTWPRSFMPANQEMRNLVAKMKLIANKDLLKGKRLLCCDDSIVRGTQLRDNTKILFDDGAKEVHMRIACPPLVYGCRFINFTSSKSDRELITRRIIEEFEGPNPSQETLQKYTETDSPEYKRMVSEIARRLNLSSLKFTKLEDLVKAIGLPKCQICTHCFDGSSAFTLEETNV